MHSPVNVRYIGPHEAVEILDGQVEKIATRGEPLEVSYDLAYGVAQKGDPNLELGYDIDGNEIVPDGYVEAYAGALGGLLDQEENWVLADEPDLGDVDDITDLTVAELKQYATDHDIDLGDAKKRDDILVAIAAHNTPEGSDQ